MSKARMFLTVAAGACVALFAALLTSLSYASLGSRYPRAGGAAYVTDRAFGEEMHPQNGLACAGTAANQVSPSSQQPSMTDFIKTGHTGGDSRKFRIAHAYESA